MKRIMNMKNFFASSAWRLGGAALSCEQAREAAVFCARMFVLNTDLSKK
jgi:hypothetical protein